MNRLLKRVVSGIVTAAIALGAAVVSPDIVAGLNVPVNVESKTWDDESKWHIIENRTNKSNITTDTKNVYKDSAYSLKIVNTDYNGVYLGKTVKVKPEQQYIVSAYVKCKGYKMTRAQLRRERQG